MWFNNTKNPSPVVGLLKRSNHLFDPLVMEVLKDNGWHTLHEMYARLTNTATRRADLTIVRHAVFRLLNQGVIQQQGQVYKLKDKP